METAYKNLRIASTSFQKIKSIKELPIGNFKIDAFRLQPTRYGNCLTIQIGVEWIFLPGRFAKYIKSQNQVDELNQKHLIMSYEGYVNGNAVINFNEIEHDAMEL